MRFGDRGEDVRTMQERLDALGYALPMYGSDGQLGDETWDALQDFGRDSVDGLVVDERILNALKSAPAPRGAPPVGAVLEAELGEGVALYDVCAQLPIHKRKRYRTRPTDVIRRCYLHHSGADGADGFAGMFASARFVVEDPDREWPGFAYTYWLCAHADADDRDRLAVYRGSPDRLRTYHTGGEANTHGVAVCFQGDRTNKPPTADQLAMADALLPWLLERHELDISVVDREVLSTHSRSKRFGGTGKPTCPGRFVEAYVDALIELA